MKLITVVNAHNVIESLADNDAFGAHIAYWMTKFVVKTQPDADFFNSELKKLFDKYGVVEGDETIIKPDKVKDFNDELEKLQAMEAEDPGIRFSLSELTNEIKISMKQMYPLLEFIEEDSK